MVKFVNLNNGNVYDGELPFVHYFDNAQSINLIYTKCICVISDKSSINISVNNNSIFKLIDLKEFDEIEDFNDQTMDTINGVKYIDLAKYGRNKIENYPGVSYNGYFLFPIYFTSSSNYVGEYTAEFMIDEVYTEINTKNIVESHTYVIGAEFYDENESLKINLSNFGLEIPESIQKALYTTNVREDKIDYITLNRKWKELLSNYWDIIANKGSYKSLENSLKWFEYGDFVKLKEFWKHDDFDKTIYDSRSLNSIIIDKYEAFIKTYYKTTYLSLHLALLQLSKNIDNRVIYDRDLNPTLSKISFNWSIHDLMLKMCMLGNFFETYFMPIHLDLILSTIEDIVFTNTIKIINGATTEIEESLNNFLTITCNIKDNDIFYLNDVSILVGYNTKLANRIYNTINKDAFTIPLYFTFEDKSRILFENGDKMLIKYEKDPSANQYKTLYYDKADYEAHLKAWEENPSLPKPDDMTYENTAYIIGVDQEIEACSNQILDNEKLNNDARTFYSQNYTGPGVMVKFKCSLVLDDEDYIKKEIISYIPDNNINGKWMTKIMYDIFDLRKEDTEGHLTRIIDIPFNILCREAREYYIKLQFETAAGLIYTKLVKFTVADAKGDRLFLYKICHKLYPENKKKFDKFERTNINNTTFGRVPDLPNHENFCNLIVPACKIYNNINTWEGVCLNNILILKGPVIYAGEQYNGSSETLKQYLEDNYFIFVKHVKSNLYYTVCVSNTFNFKPNEIIINNALGLTGSIYRNDYGYFPEFHELKEFGGMNFNSNIITDKDTLCVVPEFAYGTKLKIYQYEWIFKNASTGEEIKIPVSIKEPFIANTESQLLTPGYYNIIFKYSLTNDKHIHTMIWNSAFIKKI